MESVYRGGAYNISSLLGVRYSLQGGTGKNKVNTRLFTGSHERAPTVHLRHQ